MNNLDQPKHGRKLHKMYIPDPRIDWTTHGQQQPTTKSDLDGQFT